MFFNLFPISWIFDPEFWIISGLSLIILDIFLASFFLLPIGAAALFMSAIIYFGKNNDSQKEIFSSWSDVAIAFGIISLICVFFVQIIFRIRRRDREDINKY